MSLARRMILMAALVPLAAGCDFADMDARVVKVMADTQPIRPGLEPLYRQRAEVPPSVPETLPESVPLPGWVLPFPPGRLGGAQAETLLAGDPMALRFLALKQLTEKGAVPVDDSAARKEANKGALLPLSTPRPPAAGLDRPIPPLADVLSHFTDLGDGVVRGDDRTRAAQRAFLLDSLLPRQPAARQQYSPPDLVSARKLRERLGRLEDAGLVTPEERAEETAALDALMAGGILPEVLEPPKPPEPPKKKKKAGAGRGSRLSGGVSGKLEVIPSPPGAEPPRLAAGAKGPAGIHLLSMGVAAHGDKAWDALKIEHPELAALSFKVSRADLGDLGVTYRLIAGPVEPAQAEQLCALLKTRGQTCTPTPFPAQ